MNTISIKKDTFIMFLALLASIAYGFFVAASLQRLHSSGSGDIAALLNFFENIDIFVLNNNYSVIAGDGLFRLLVVFLENFFNAETISVLSAIAFTVSSTVFFIYLINIRSTTYLIYILPLFLMVFMSPNVVNLYASGIRSGIAFTLLLIAITNRNAGIRYILLSLSSVIHLSMVPLISFYFLFHILRNRRINASSLSCYVLVALYSSSLATFAYVYQYNVTALNSSIYFNFLTFCFALLLLFTSKKAIKNVFGFMSIGIILVVIAGNILDVSFSRYAGNALILYLFFLIKEANPDTIKVFSLGYAPYFALTTFFSIANQL